MKLNTAKRSDSLMRYFTPELYRRFNSPDDDVADEASDAWEAAIAEYQAHLKELDDRLPASVRRLSRLNLHDSEVIAVRQEVSPGIVPDMSEPFGWTSIAIVSLRVGEEILSLIYLLWDRIEEEAPPDRWPFSPNRKHWLYDEVDAVKGRHWMFVHRVLFSDGSVLRIPFISVTEHKLPMLVAEPVRSKRRKSS